MKRRIWVIADTHLGHHKMVELAGRPCDFSEKVLSNLCGMVYTDDILVHLGDVCIGDDVEWHEKLAMNSCKNMILVRGNHDSKSNNWYMDHGWSFVAESFTWEIFGVNILFSHRPQAHAGLNIHGHLHTLEHRNEKPNCLVSLEKNNYKPELLSKVVMVTQ